MPRLAGYIVLDLANGGRAEQRERMQKLRETFEQIPGETKVSVHVDTGKYKVDLLLPSEARINVTNDNFRMLKRELGEDKVHVKSKGYKAPPRRRGNGKGRFRNGRSS